jgi:hypothetical protein
VRSSKAVFHPEARQEAELKENGVRIQAQQGWCFSVDFPRSGDLSL